jgi:hypothetical protein
MNKVVFASEATIQTAAVEVKTMTIGKRQMTLSLFRQVRDEDLIDLTTGELDGTPWGVIDYHWPGCVGPISSADHFHVLWQKGKELRRCAVYRDPSKMPVLRDEIQDFRHLIEAGVAAVKILQAQGEWRSTEDRLAVETDTAGDVVAWFFNCDGSLFRADDVTLRCLLKSNPMSDYDRNRLEQLINGAGGDGMSMPAVLEWVDSILGSISGGMTRYRQAAEALAQLDQLYLAG